MTFPSFGKKWCTGRCWVIAGHPFGNNPKESWSHPFWWTTMRWLLCCFCHVTSFTSFSSRYVFNVILILSCYISYALFLLFFYFLHVLYRNVSLFFPLMSFLLFLSFYIFFFVSVLFHLSCMMCTDGCIKVSSFFMVYFPIHLILKM